MPALATMDDINALNTIAPSATWAAKVMIDQPRMLAKNPPIPNTYTTEGATSQNTPRRERRERTRIPNQLDRAQNSGLRKLYQRSCQNPPWPDPAARSEERRVGKEGRCQRSDDEKYKRRKSAHE